MTATANTRIIAGTTCGAAKKNATRAMTVPAKPSSTERSMSQSARTPASHDPMTEPMPNASRNHGIHESDLSATLVTSGAM